MSEITLSPSEQAAYQAVQDMGMEAAQNEINALDAKADATMRSLCGNDLLIIPIGYTALDYMSEEDLDRRHFLTIGVMLNTSNPAAEARKRILARREARRQARSAA